MDRSFLRGSIKHKGLRPRFNPNLIYDFLSLFPYISYDHGISMCQEFSESMYIPLFGDVHHHDNAMCSFVDVDKLRV